jgi:golgin subfamily B member 1
MNPRGEEPRTGPPQDWLRVVEQLLEGAEAATESAERAGLLCRVAEVYERRLGDPDSALLTLEAAFKEDPGSGLVVQDMERLARSSGRWPQVIASTAAVAGALTDARHAADLWVQIAFWCDSGLGRIDDAADAARTALSLVPDHGGAIAVLENLYRRQRDWGGYVEVLDRKWSVSPRDPEKMAEAYADVLKNEPGHRGALEGLVRVHEQASQWEEAAQALRLLAAVAPDGERVPLYHRAGVMRLERLADNRGAEEDLTQALALSQAAGEPHVPSMLALVEIYRARAEWLNVRQMLGRAADAGATPADKARHLFDAAEICRLRLDDDVQAAEIYEAVLAIDPTHAGAAEPLAEIWFRRGAWTALLPVAERLVAEAEAEAATTTAATATAVAGRPAAERARLAHRLARAAEELGDDERALATYRRSFELDRTHLPTVRDLGALAFRRQAWPEAALALGTLVEKHASALRRDEMLEALDRWGLALLSAGDPARAMTPLERALALDHRRRATLEALVDAASGTGDFAAMSRYAQALLTLTEDRDTRVAIHERLAAIHRGRRADPQRAITALLAALDEKADGEPPRARAIMHQLLELLTETKQWRQAVSVLMRLAELDEGSGRARTLVAAGNILHYELGADPEAVEAFNRALDADPDDVKTFERIDKLVTAMSDFKMQERCYRRQIKRLGNDVPLEKRPALLALWRGLGEIYRSRLQDTDAAIAAFEVAASLDPDDAEGRADTGKILAELYEAAGPDAYAKAVDEHRLLVRRAGDAVAMAPHLRQLLRLFVELGQLDHAFCAAQALVALGQADPEERALFEQHRPRAPVRAQARMTEELWQRSLCHPDQDRLLSQILATVSPAVAAARARPHKDWGLRRKQRRDVAADPTPFCQALAYASGVLGVPLPEVYLFPESPGEVDVANTRETLSAVPAFLVGSGALAGRSESELGYIVARNLALLRPDALVRWPAVVPTVAELEAVVHAAIRLVEPEAAVPAALAGAAAPYSEVFARLLPPQLVEQLTILVARLRGAGGAFDIGRWAGAGALTAIRAGLLVCGDLEVALRLGGAHAAAAGIDPQQVTRDLVQWNVSDEYFTLRARLGLGAVAS